MLKQLIFIFSLLVCVVLNAQESAWQKFISEDNSSPQEKNAFVIVELSHTELMKLKKEGLNELRRLDQNHFIFPASKELEGRTMWAANNEWKLNIKESDKKKGQFIIKLVDNNRTDFLDNVEIIARSSDNIIVIEASYEAINTIAINSNVVFISDEVTRPTTEARVIDMNINPNRINKIHHFFPEINGSTELVSIQENMFDQVDIDLLGRSIKSGLESEILDNHASEMATIIAGAGNSFVTGKGVALEASITSSNFFPALPNNDENYQSLGINVQNHSYGTVLETFYGVQAEAFDLSAVNNPNLLHVFSIGNQGLVVDNEGTYSGIEGYANITGNFKMSKNTLSVGSVDTVGREIQFVSRGPAYDGRVKPEMVAYSSVGSSNSAALVSGISVLLQHQYRAMFSQDMPSAMVKALLINCADDVGSEGLDFVTGYGSVNAYNSLRVLQKNQFFVGSVLQDETDQIELNLPSNAVNLKLTIVWTDPAANPGDATALVNDLDIRLTDGAFNSILPWVLDHTPTKSLLSAKATRGVDRLNNVEQITISNPDETYLIEVEGFSVEESQDYYIVYQYDIDDSFEWDYPTGSDNMPYNGESGSYFRWNSTISGVGELSYSLDQGINWIVLDSSVDISKGYWRWSTVPDLSREVIGRMRIGVESFETEYFTISRPFKSKVGFNCSDSLMLRWPSISNATSYTIYNMGMNDLEEVTTTTDTFLIFNNKGALLDKRFSIQPNLESISSIRSPTFDYALQGVDCYVISFFQQVVLDTGIYLNLNLGTTYGIEELTFYRLEGLERIEIENIKNPEKDLVNVLDSNPNQGYNEHIVLVRFKNGEEIALSSGISSYVTEVPLIVFPNPISIDQELTILFKEFESQNPIFRIFDIKGSSLLMEVSLSTQESIPVNQLNPGIYIYRLEDGGIVHSGRLIVR